VQLLFVMVTRNRVKVKRHSYSVHAAKACRGSGGLTPALEGDEWSPPRVCRFTPGK
jgi:hypothetical protein